MGQILVDIIVTTWWNIVCFKNDGNSELPLSFLIEFSGSWNCTMCEENQLSTVKLFVYLFQILYGPLISLAVSPLVWLSFFWHFYSCSLHSGSIDLLNVSFGGPSAPDRISAIAGVKELSKVSPSRGLATVIFFCKILNVYGFT